MGQVIPKNFQRVLNYKVGRLLYSNKKDTQNFCI